jgi:hypothetical protein
MKKWSTIILPVIMYGRETSSLTLREQYMLTIFENRVLKRIFGPKRYQIIRCSENYIMRSFITCILRQKNRMIKVKENKMGRACSTSGEEEECILDIGGKA